jgi:hypothetical protein
MIKHGLLALLLLFFTTPGYAALTLFSGVYHCKGTDPYENKSYSGTVTITPQHGVYQLEMDYDDGANAVGTGGQYDPTLLSVVFQDKNNLKHIGLEQYTFTPDHKTIQGYWVYLGDHRLGKEVCEKS